MNLADLQEELELTRKLFLDAKFAEKLAWSNAKLAFNLDDAIQEYKDTHIICQVMRESFIDVRTRLKHAT